MSHITLVNYYKLIFTLKRDFAFSVQEIEDLMVFERDVYLDIIKSHLEELKNGRQE